MTLPRFAILAALAAAPAQAMTFYSVGTADIDGGYYRVMTQICRFANGDGDPGMRCSPEPTAGSVYNLTALEDGQLELALVQSDWLQDAATGRSIFEGRPFADLRMVLQLYSEQATFLVRRGAGIAGFGDLAGKRVDLGLPSSGRHATALRLLDAFGLAREDLAAVTELPAGPALDELCAGRLDATVLVTGHPSAAVARVLADCEVDLLPLAAPEVARLVTSNGGLELGRIPAGTYAGQEEAVETFAMRTTLVGRADTDPAIVDDVVRAVVDNLARLRRENPLLSGLTVESMRGREAAVPLHPAAGAAFDTPRDAASD